MLPAFLTFLNEYPLPLIERPTLLAVSGGVDSMVLATLFYQKKFPFAIAHCNFNLRGTESDEDEKFVIAWAEARAIPVHVRQFDTLAEKKSRGVSTQMAARDLRYAWFEELRTRHDYAFVATAHHTDDAIETLLLNLTRGTGLAGLPGIASVRGFLIRPLLLAAKADILVYAQEYEVPFREDSSNASTHYRRNLLRHEVLPVLKTINPNLEGTFRYTAERLRAAENILNEVLTQWRYKVQRREGDTVYISIVAIQEAKEPLYHLHYCLDAFGFNYQQSRQIVSVLGQTSGKRFFSASHRLVVDRTELIIQENDATTGFAPILIYEDTRHVSLSDNESLLISRKEKAPDFTTAPASVAYFDAQTLVFPFTLRIWQVGDWFCPIGMAGKRKKVSDLLVDRKIPVSDKANIRVLVDAEGRIAWVVGLRTDHRFRVREGTKQVIEFALITK